MSKFNNIFFDSDTNDNRENIDSSSQVIQSRCLMSGSFQFLGNLTPKSNGHRLNAIMRQADCQIYWTP